MIHGHSRAVAFPCSVTCCFPPLSGLSLCLSESSQPSPSVSPVCASVQTPPQSSAVTSGHLNPSKGSGLSQRLSQGRESGFCFSPPGMTELREGTEGTDLADTEHKTVLLNICQDNPSTGLRVLLLIYTIRREELESYHSNGETVLRWLCHIFAKAPGPQSNLLYALSHWTNSTDSAQELFPAAALSKAGQSSALLSQKNTAELKC